MKNNDKPLHENNFSRNFSPSGQEKQAPQKLKYNDIPLGFWKNKETPPADPTTPPKKA
jgi:hypothetical protein